MSRRFRRPFPNFTEGRKNELAALLVNSGLAEIRSQRVALCKKINAHTPSINFFDDDEQTFCTRLVYRLADQGHQSALLTVCREIREVIGETYYEAIDAVVASMQNPSIGEGQEQSAYRDVSDPFFIAIEKDLETREKVLEEMRRKKYFTENILLPQTDEDHDPKVEYDESKTLNSIAILYFSGKLEEFGELYKLIDEFTAKDFRTLNLLNRGTKRETSSLPEKSIGLSNELIQIIDVGLKLEPGHRTGFFTSMRLNKVITKAENTKACIKAAITDSEKLEFLETAFNNLADEIQALLGEMEELNRALMKTLA